MEQKRGEHAKAMHELMKSNAANEKRLQIDLREKDDLFDKTFVEHSMKILGLKDTVKALQEMKDRLEGKLVKKDDSNEEHI